MRSQIGGAGAMTRGKDREKDRKMDLTTTTLLRRPADFGFHDSDHPACSDPRHWTLGPVFRTRDSGLLEQSNAAALLAHLEERPDLSDEWRETRAGHWAVGWVEHLSFRVLGDDGEETVIYRLICDWFDALSDYPIADEEDFSRREEEALYASVLQSGQRHVRDDVGDEWVGAVVAYLGAHDLRQLESRGNDGPSPDDAAVLDALRELNLVEREDEDEDEDEDGE